MGEQANLLLRYGFDPSPASRAEQEVAAGFRAGKYRPVLEAYSMAETRLVATADHFMTLADVLHKPESVYAVSALARTALETSSRVGWLLDPAIDGRTRGLRWMGEHLYALSEESKYPIPERDIARNRVTGLISAARSARVQLGWDRKHRKVLHFGEARPDATTVIKKHMDIAGELAYRELSAIAHGNQTALIRQTEVVPLEEHPSPSTVAEGVSITRPVASPASVVPKLVIVCQSYLQALEAKVTLYGWDIRRFEEWAIPAAVEMGKLLEESGETVEGVDE